MQPLASICIPTHNSAMVVADALLSALRQDYSPLEIIVSDNDSSDETCRIVTRIANEDPRVRMLRQGQNIGMVRNFNACISAAKGEFVLVLCADDALDVSCVRMLVHELRQNSEAALAAVGRIFADPELRPREVRRARSRREKVEGTRLARECFAHGNRIGEPSAVLFRRSLAARGFDPDYSQCVDIEMWLHLLERGSGILLPDALSVIRQHADQVTQANVPSGRIVADKQRLYMSWARKIEKKMSALECLAWDARMASSVALTNLAGKAIDPAVVTETFFPSYVFRLLCGSISLGWRIRKVLSI